MKTKLILLITIFSLVTTTYIFAHTKCQDSYPKQTNQNNYETSYEDCPCFNSSSDIYDAIDNAAKPTRCMSSNDYSILTGGDLDFTSQTNNKFFSCHYQNFVNKNIIEEVVEYASVDEVNQMHVACNALIKEFARNNKINCQ